jgi:hypothetical protein
MEIELSVVKAQTIQCVKVNFGNVRDAIKSSVGRKVMQMI